MIDLPTLYPHQEDHKDRVRASLRTKRRVVLCANPGVGKTRCSKWIMGSAMNREPGDGQTGRSLFAVHRRGLVDNASNSFAEDPKLPHGVLMSGTEHAIHQRVQVGSIDTLISWWCEDGKYDTDVTFDLIVYDECHSHLSKLKVFHEAHERKRAELGLKPSYVIGLSATPECKGINFFEEIITGPTTEWLIENRYLSPFRYFRCQEGDLSKLVKRGGEFTKDSVSEAMDGLAGDLVRDWTQHAEGRATVGFFPRRTHAKEARALLEIAGIKAEYVDGETDDERRRQLFRFLNDGLIDYICNVGVVERGTDIPRIGCVQLCTAVGSLVRYRQMIGRGSRVHPEKTDCLVLDHGGNVKRHGFFEDEVAWTLDVSTKATKEHEARPTIECPQCSAIYRGGKCRKCGYEPTPKERKSQGLVFTGSELTEIKRTERKEQEKKSCHDIMVSALYAAGRSGRTWKQALAIAYRNAEKQGTRFRVPREVEVAGRTYRMLPYGHPDGGRRVKHLYPFTVGDYQKQAVEVG